MFLILFALSPAPRALSQVPQGFNYQAVLRDDPSNNPIVSQGVQIRFTIQTAGAVVVYQETHATTTDEFGAISLVVGGGTPVGAYVFSNIDWSVPLSLKTEFEYPVSGTPDYDKLMGTTALKSVPYALTADGFTQPLDKLLVKGSTSSFEEALFEVKNNNDQTIFAVYNEGVKIFVDDGAKGPKGGFTVGGFGTTKTSQEYLRVTRDSTRVYVNPNPPGKGPKGGFAIGATGTKGLADNFLNLSPNNYFIGHSSGMGIDEGLYNTVFGYQAGMALTDGSSNIFIGQDAGLVNNTGSNNIFIGNSAGASNTSGAFNIFMGNSSGYRNEDGIHNTYIGYQSGYSGGYLTTDPSYNTYIGYQSGYNNRTGQYNTFVGHKTGYSGSSANGNRNVFMGDSAGFKNISGDDNVFIGKAAGQGNSVGDFNVIMGSKAGYLNDGDYNVFIGFESGRNNTAGTGANGNWNTFIGYRSGRANTTGWHNMAIGYEAGLVNQTATNQFYIGNSSGSALTAGYGNTFVGHLTGSKSTDCSENTFIGYQTGWNNQTGDNNTILGYAAGINSLGSGNVFLGRRAGFDETGDNKLYIDNSGTASPLIYGDFTNTTEYLVFNGNVGIKITPTHLIDLSGGAYCDGGAWVNGSDLNLKENFEAVNGEEILKLIGSLPITKWNYKAEDQSIKHIGPVAQDFYSLFGLGGDDKSISTVDPSGIALAAVKELSRQNMSMREQIDSQQQQLDQLSSLIIEMRSEIASLRSQ